MAKCFDPLSVTYGQEGHCEYLRRINGRCLRVRKITQQTKQFTMSYDFMSDNWVFFHAYQPAGYFRNRTKAYCYIGANIYHMNSNDPGVYMEEQADQNRKFILEPVGAFGQEIILNSVSWDTKVLNDRFNSFHNISARTRFENTGLQPASSKRDIRGMFSHNRFRDLTLGKLRLHTDTIFHDYVPLTVSNPMPAWWKRGYLYDNFVIVRLERDPDIDNRIITFLGMTMETNKSTR